MKISKELAKTYYTAADAQKVLGLDEEAFQYWGRTQRITRIYLPGRKQAVYSKKEVNEIADRIEATAIADQPDSLEFRKATLEDMEAEHELSYNIFGKWAHTTEVRKAFLKRSRDGYYHLYDHNKLVGFIEIIPFNKETIEQFIDGKIRGREIDPENTEEFTPGKPLECIVMEMSVTQAVPPSQRTFYGSRLIVGIAGVFRAWGENGIEITKLHATSSTPTGIRILKSAGFQVVKDLDNKRLGFELDLTASDAKILRGYKEALEEWKQKRNAKDTTKTRKRKTPIGEHVRA